MSTYFLKTGFGYFGFYGHPVIEAELIEAATELNNSRPKRFQSLIDNGGRPYLHHQELWCGNRGHYCEAMAYRDDQ